MRRLTPQDLRAQTRVAGPDDGLGPVVDLELGEDAADVVADGLVRDGQPPGDLPVVEPGGDQVEDLQLARSQPREGLLPGRGRQRAEEGLEPPGDARAEDRAPDVVVVVRTCSARLAAMRAGAHGYLV